MLVPGKQDRKESTISPGCVSTQESEVSVILPTLGRENLELGTEALTWVVREVLDKVFEARINETSDML
ncbi:hypothetical protein PVK06_024089 [Gossypium arboreum]|uniref:Uncharacterized protein n=1 Tax=Gossypium arboreum TaxID=29729 RepID=A0ABR0PD49_GOSAR|nr:hypothetical protein PVK06_024089 [Gossypium arboreum]